LQDDRAIREENNRKKKTPKKMGLMQPGEEYENCGLNKYKDI